MSHPIPKTVNEILEEFDRLEKTGINNERKTGLRCALNSSSIKRAHDKCIVLMSGETGVGKSSLTNNVFGVDLCRTSNVTSETKAATEFSLKVELPRLKISDMQVSIVDTPGMCDTEGLGQDARNVRAIQKYVDSSVGQDNYPNMILLLIKATDNRFVGKNSKLSKTIRSLEALNIIDRNCPNLIVVITHIMSIAKKLWDKKKQEIQKCVKNVCFIVPPVVFVENEAREYDLEIEETTGYSKLPNGDVQPLNVIEAILEQFDDNQDRLARTALNEVCSKGDLGCNAEETLKVLATDMSTPMTNEEQRIKKMLEEQCDINEIERKVQEYAEKDKLDKRDVAEIGSFCRKIVNDLGIRSISELQKNSAQFLLDLTGYELEDRARATFAEIFDLNNSFTLPVACQDLRRGFNVLTNEFSNAPLFADLQFSRKVFSSLKKTNFHRTYFNYEVHNNTDEFIKSYLVQKLKNDLYISEKYKSIISPIRPRPQNDRFRKQFLLCDWEVRIRQIEMPDPKQLLPSVQFRTASRQLPEKCDVSDRFSMQKYESFCRRFGTHFIRKAFCGGQVQVGGYMNRIRNDTVNQIISDEVFKVTEHWCSKSSPAAELSRLAILNLDIHLSDPNQTNDNQLTIGEKTSKLTAKTSEEMSQWLFNLPNEMVILKNDLEITPISELIKIAGFPKQAEAMDYALVFILSDVAKMSQIFAKQNQEMEAIEAEVKWEQTKRKKKKVPTATLR